MDPGAGAGGFPKPKSSCREQTYSNGGSCLFPPTSPNNGTCLPSPSIFIQLTTSNVFAQGSSIPRVSVLTTPVFFFFFPCSHPQLSLSLTSKAGVSLPNPYSYKHIAVKCNVVTLTICGIQFLFHTNGCVLIQESQIPPLFHWWGNSHGAGNFLISSSLLMVPVLAFFLFFLSFSVFFLLCYPVP